MDNYGHDGQKWEMIGQHGQKWTETDWRTFLSTVHVEKCDGGWTSPHDHGSLERLLHPMAWIDKKTFGPYIIAASKKEEDV
jgi:hypothetical protein